MPEKPPEAAGKGGGWPSGPALPQNPDSEIGAGARPPDAPKSADDAASTSSAASPALTREEIAHREVGRTNVAPGVALLLASLFLVSIYGVPCLQHLDDASEYVRGGRSSWVPQCYSILGVLAESADAFRQADGGPITRVVTANRRLLRGLRRYEDALQDSSWLSRELLPPTQGVLSRWFRVGNEKVYVGRKGWLFYRPDVEYVTGPGFLSRRHARSRTQAAREWDSVPRHDPVGAIAGFNDQMKARGIRLIVMPTPVKPSIHPEKLSRAYRASGDAVENPSFDDFLKRLRARGIEVFDCAGLLAGQHGRTGQPQYLAGDTHWRPEAMDGVASALAFVIERRASLSPAALARYRREPVRLSSVGDLRAMLKEPESRRAELEPVQIKQVLSADHELWRADRGAEVLVLGDSFSNIYSLPAMGWGEAAGFVEQLSFHLQRPVDRVVQNDNGAYATREALLRECAANPGRLKGTRVVVWQFASRELAFGDWQAAPFGP